MNKYLVGSFALALGLFAIVGKTTYSKAASINKDTIVLSSKNKLSLSDEVNGESVGEVIREAKKLDREASLFSSGNDPMYLFENTPGGEIQSGLELNEGLKGLKRPVKTITLFAASMGFQIVQNLDERLILKNGTLMSHRARGGVQGEFGGKSPGQLENRINFWLKRLTELDRTTVKRTNGKQTLASYQDAYENELWLTGEEAVEKGYADRVVTVTCDDSLDGVVTKQTQFFGMVISYDLDKCPLNTSPSNIRAKIETTKGYMFTDEFVKSGGQFGAACLVGTDPTRLCALDTTLNIMKLEEVKMKFISNYQNKLRQVVYNYGVF